MVKASTKDEALNMAAEHFDCNKDEITLRTVEEAKKFFGKVISPYVFKAEYEKPEETEVKVDDAETLENQVLENKDGSFEIIFTDEGVRLDLEYPTGNGDPVSYGEIMATIERKHISDVHINAIREALNFHSNSTIIADKQEEILINETVKIGIPLNKMEATAIFVLPDGGNKLTFEEFTDAIAKEKIVYGMDSEKLLEIFNNREYGTEYVIATGLESINGEDAKIKLKHDFNRKPKPKEDEDGTVDYFDLDMFISVDEGEVVGEYQEPTNGVDGCDVFGHVVKAVNGKKVKLPIGKNVALSEDGTQLIAKKTGLLQYLNDKLSVTETLVIDGDVDLSTGNIDFVGNIKVRGSVIPGMFIRADGSVEVDGAVESSQIEATGSIILKGGIRGLGKSELKAAGNVEAKYIENASVISRACVKTESIMNSEIECFDLMTPTGGKGVILGGNIRALHSVICGALGSESSNANTVIEVGDFSENRKKMKEIEKQMEAIKIQLERIRLALNTKNEDLSQMQKVMFERLKDEEEKRSQILVDLNEQMNKLTSKIEHGKDCFISVLGTANAGVELTISRATLILDSEYVHTTFKCVDGEIAIAPYEG